MDYSNGSDDEQKEDFVKMLRLAKELDKPVVIHSRKAEEDVLHILEKEKMKMVVLHCFCGKKKFIKKRI